MIPFPRRLLGRLFLEGNELDALPQQRSKRGDSVGSRGYGYANVLDGETNDEKRRLRADGFELVIVPEEASHPAHLSRFHLGVSRIAQSRLGARPVPR